MVRLINSVSKYSGYKGRSRLGKWIFSWMLDMDLSEVISIEVTWASISPSVGYSV